MNNTIQTILAIMFLVSALNAQLSLGDIQFIDPCEIEHSCVDALTKQLNAAKAKTKTTESWEPLKAPPILELSPRFTEAFTAFKQGTAGLESYQALQAECAKNLIFTQHLLGYLHAVEHPYLKKALENTEERVDRSFGLQLLQQCAKFGFKPAIKQLELINPSFTTKTSSSAVATDQLLAHTSLLHETHNQECQTTALRSDSAGKYIPPHRRVKASHLAIDAAPHIKRPASPRQTFAHNHSDTPPAKSRYRSRIRAKAPKHVKKSPATAQ